jgi:hypothetical protein
MAVKLNRISSYLCYFKCQNCPTHFQPITVYKHNISILPFVANTQQVIQGKNRHPVMALKIILCSVHLVHLGQVKSPRDRKSQETKCNYTQE